MKISIIIPTVFQRQEMLVDLLSDLEKLKGKSDFEIIVVDNGLEENRSLKKLIGGWHSRLPIRLIYEKQNGLHHARHTGAAAATGAILIYIDDDVRISPGWLSEYEKVFQSSSINCAGGKVIPEWEEEPPRWIKNLNRDIFSLLDYGDSERVLNEKEGINGCNFAIRKDVLFRYKGFNPDGFIDPSKKWYRGDGEYGLVQRIKKGGEKIFYIPMASIVHRISLSRISEEAIYKAVENQAFSKAYTFLRRHGCSTFSILLLIVGGAVKGFFYSLRAKLTKDQESHNVLYYESVKFYGIMKYTIHVLTDKHLMNFINQADYLTGTQYGI